MFGLAAILFMLPLDITPACSMDYCGGEDACLVEARSSLFGPGCNGGSAINTDFDCSEVPGAAEDEDLPASVYRAPIPKGAAYLVKVGSLCGPGSPQRMIRGDDGICVSFEAFGCTNADQCEEFTGKPAKL